MPRDACVYQRPHRPHWFVAYFCPHHLRRIHVATAFRCDDPTGRRRALAFALEKSRAAADFRGHTRREAWGAWVERYIADRYGNSPLTFTRVVNAWTWLHAYLAEHKLPTPDAVGYLEVSGYIPWRLAQRRTGGKNYSRNTAITELKFFGLICQEAVRRGYCAANVCANLRLSRDPAREKPELSDAEIAILRAECARRESHLPIAEQWLTTSLEIALHTWCRLSSTSVPLERIDFAAAEMTLRTKGRKLGIPSFLTVPIHPDLMPRLLALRAAGASHTCLLPRMAAKEWWSLRQAVGLGHTSFHSTRVTGISRARRAGVPESFAMRLAGHNSPAVHRIYQRGTTADLTAQLEKVRFAPLPPGPPESGPPQSPRAPQTTPTAPPGSQIAPEKGSPPSPAKRSASPRVGKR